MGEHKYFTVNTFLVFLIILISIFWVYSITAELHSTEETYVNLAIETAESYSEAVRDIRDWATRHGGVYVQVTEENTPNPYLNTENREVIIDNDFILTKLNPAYVTRQVSEISDERTGIYFTVVSIEPVNPANMADSWEEHALDSFTREGADKVYEVIKTEAGQLFRYITPIYLVEGCKGCHEEQDRPVGEVRGGISVAFPYEAFEKSRTEQLVRNIIIYTIFYLLFIFFVIFFGKKLVYAEKERQVLFAELEKIAHTDKLTALASRHYFFINLEQEIQRHKRYDSILSLIIIDLNNFKQINDRYGHLIGDEALKLASQIIKDNIRTTDLAGRLGGDEFVIMLPETGIEQAEEIGERLRESFEQAVLIIGEGNQKVDISASLGASNINLLEKDQSIEEVRNQLIAKADKAMYKAKKMAVANGGSCIMISED
ncbi:diguanylate cyclase [Desulfuribacillus alkaliarsenatis]|uniref:GGDEF domain-containing protein n=1 Tax=Desulfuribacillus alkaliarsenatis TaxID=766136 RepID=A0A1E5G351_9FIRM|nr:diguanylate cyclase [Desulfuribacillus alkaliarsenatis]OEF97022.1 hypothetical protein BHF68_05325 [Desulfuribacillus alkaliarsenatis]